MSQGAIFQPTTHASLCGRSLSSIQQGIAGSQIKQQYSSQFTDDWNEGTEELAEVREDVLFGFVSAHRTTPSLPEKNSWILNSDQARSEKAICSAVCWPGSIGGKEKKNARPKGACQFLSIE